MIPTIRFQILKYSQGNYVQLFWGELTKGQHEAGAEQHKLGTTGGTTRGQHTGTHPSGPSHHSQRIHQASHGLVTLTRSWARQVAALTRRRAAGPDRWSMGNPAHTATQGVNRLFALWGVGVVFEASRGLWTVSWDDDRTQEFALGASSTKSRT